MANYELRIESLMAFHQTEDDGDELFIKINDSKIWPSGERFQKISATTPAPIQYTIPLEKLQGNLEVELWEYDNLISSKHIGSFNLDLSTAGGPFHSDLKMTSKEFARYTLVWEIARVLKKI